jgi:hypothetical protein
LSALGPVSVASADLNGDGILDLVVGNSTTNYLSIFLGHGDGTFQASPIYYRVGNNPLSIAVADLNGDGKLDLAVANVNDNYVSILQGNGDGTFSEAINYAAAKGPSAIAVGDFNGDGRSDLAIPSYWLNGLSILLNNTPLPVQLIKVASRMMHGTAGAFDINLALTGTPGIECRSGGATGDYMLVFTFVSSLTNVGAVSASATGNGPAPGATGMIDSTDAHRYLVNLSNVPNAQYTTVSLTNVTDSLGNFSSGVSITMGVLLGDVNGDGQVDSADLIKVKQQTLQPVNDNPGTSNFREDVNTDGNIDSSDLIIVKRQTLTGLPTHP